MPGLAGRDPADEAPCAPSSVGCAVTNGAILSGGAAPAEAGIAGADADAALAAPAGTEPEAPTAPAG